ncbi:Chromosome partition protein Smc [Stieleria maiorica]|uniref:Chromosome partition protein Smc n=1 Tax=Stieleria maiorica TaxID=2795974 RepID=A0A5B9MAS9_9BACT|nr:FHA domain-containing protein [Stieleria maiorica]QEF96337.1 Chromosome partition protein Smc [Stieleria maiorica]
MIRSTQATLAGFKIRLTRQSASPIDHALEEGRSVFIGQSSSCGIQIKGDKVAEIHCLVDVNDDVVSIQDWASDAGTKINGVAIDDKTEIQVGDSIVIGSVTLELVGGPSGQKDAQRKALELAAKTAEAEREESVGMETLGYDDPLPVSPPTAAPTPLAPQTGGRLSDAFVEPTAAPCDGDSGEAVTEASGAAATEHVTSKSDAVKTDAPKPEAPKPDAPAPDALTVDETEVVSKINDAAAESEDASLDDDFAPNHFTADDLDWDPSAFEDDEVDAEIVQLLKSEIEDLRIQLAERDEQLAALEGLGNDADPSAVSSKPRSTDDDFGGNELVGRVDDLLAELAEHDERVSTLQELLQTAEIQNQAEREERSCLENWVGEIEQRIGERESEWQAEQDALRDRLEAANQERDEIQQQLHVAAKRYGQASVGEIVPDETLKKLQKQNAELQTALEESQKQCVSLNRQIERLQTEEPESLQELRAELAQEKASVSRMRFQLSKQLQEIDSDAAAPNHPDGEFTYKLQALRQHLREIHEEEKIEREQKGESLLGRISNLWKRVDDEY